MKSHVMAVVKPGCPACEDSKPAIAKARKMSKKPFTEINADEHPSMVDNLGVQAFPDFVYKNSKGAVHHMPYPASGPPTASHIVGWIDGMRKNAGTKSPGRQTRRTKGCSQCTAGGIPPSEWGPPLWFIIHIVALMYPRNPTAAEQYTMMKFFRGLQPVLPCDYCKKHFAVELKTMDKAAFASRDTLFKWTVDFHDSVSERTGSTQPKQSVSYWRDYYKHALMEKQRP
jgi:hypothetical protein